MPDQRGRDGGDGSGRARTDRPPQPTLHLPSQQRDDQRSFEDRLTMERRPPASIPRPGPARPSTDEPAAVRRHRPATVSWLR